MLARAGLLALTTALALLVATPSLASSIPVVDNDKPLVAAEKPKTPISLADFFFDAFINHGQPEEDLKSKWIEPVVDYNWHAFRYPTGYKQPPYSYGNSIDYWNMESDEESNDGQEVDIECAQTLQPGGAQHPFVAVAPEKEKPLLDSHESPCGSKKKRAIGIGIDLRENVFSVGFINSNGKPELIPNEDGQFYHMAYVRFFGDSECALVGLSAANINDNTTCHDDHEPKNRVDLSKLQNADMYKVYPEDYYIGLHDEVPEKTATEVEADILAVLMQRAVDLAEAHTGRQVSAIGITYPKKILKYGPRGQLFLKGTRFDIRREEAIRTAVARLQNSVRVDSYTEILALMASHLPFFESRLEPNPDVPEGDPVFLSQMVLIYNLRDSSEDLVVMRYTKGYRGAYHLDFMAGYLPNDGIIHDKFSQYLSNFILDRFNRGVGASGKDRSHKDTVKPKIPPYFDIMADEMDLGDENRGFTFVIAEDSYVSVTLKDYMECRMQFMKERLSESVPRVLEDAALVDNSKIDHLIVVDASGFQAVSTVVLENIVFGRRSHKKAVPEADPQKAIALGIARWSG